MERTKTQSIDEGKVRRLFENYDLNKNGVLDKEEFVKIMTDILKDIGEDIPDKRHVQVAEEGLENFDLNKNGKIEFDEFYEFIEFVVSEKGYTL